MSAAAHTGGSTKYWMQQSSRETATSIQMRFLVDQSLSARLAGDADVADAFARAAEAILRSSFPQVAADIASAASRKGQGDAIGARLAQHLAPQSAACVAIVLMLRGARKPVVDALSSAFGRDLEFNETIKTLCGRVFASVSSPSNDAPEWVSIEVAASHRR